MAKISENFRMRECLYLLILCITAMIFIQATPKLTFNPTGIFLPNNNSMQSLKRILPLSTKDAGNITIGNYAPNTEPLGTISVLKHIKANNKKLFSKNQSEIQAYAKKLASQYGANYLQFINAGGQDSRTELASLNFTYKAYKI